MQAQTKYIHSINETCELVGLSRASVYREIESGRLKSIKVGARRFITPDHIKTWLQSLEAKGAANE